MASHREVMETWFHRVWAEEDTTAIDELFVPDGRARGLGANTLVGPAGFKQFHAVLCALLSEIVVTIDKSIESNDWISALCTVRAKRQASGEPLTFTGQVFIRIVDGKLTEAYNHWDFMSLYAQLGLLPSDTFERGLRGNQIA